MVHKRAILRFVYASVLYKFELRIVIKTNIVVNRNGGYKKIRLAMTKLI